MSLLALPLLLLATALETEIEGYRIDFRRGFYASKEAERRDVTRLEGLLRKVEGLRGRVASSPTSLLEALRLRDQANAVQSKLYIYHRLRYMVDTSDNASLAEANRIGTLYETRTAFLSNELARIPTTTFLRYGKKEPKLLPYSYAVEKERKAAAHRLPGDQERLLKELEPLATGWQYELYELSRSAERPDRQLRFYILRNVATSLDMVAKLRKYRSAVDASLIPLELTRAQVGRTLSDLAKERPLIVRYQSALDARRSLLAKPPQYEIKEGVDKVKEAISGLGPQFSREYDALTNPSNGRIDAAGGPNRSGLGTGWGFPASQPSILYWPAFTGTMDDLDRGLAHEGGHAVHFNLMRAKGVFPCYSDGPSYFFESFAILNQLLLADNLYRKEIDPAKKAYYLTQLLDKARYPLYMAFFASLEYAMHNAAITGRLTRPEDLDSMEQREWAKFMPDTKFDPERARWLTTQHFVSVPLYHVNYLFASVLALKYFELYQRDRGRFVPRYFALVSNGFDAPPDVLLKRYLGISLNDPKLVADSLSLLRSKVKELETLKPQ